MFVLIIIMEINIGSFIKNLTYYIKIGIYINKGTDKDIILDRCIKLYNKYKTIEASSEITITDETFVRKCAKRLNLILKIENNGYPVDIKNKENQRRMIFLEPHPSIINNDLGSMLKYAEENNIKILTEIPLLFILRDSKYKELLWQYTRLLFYISQILISKVSTDADMNNPIISKKSEIFDDSLEYLETILYSIDEIEEKLKVDQMMKLDNFLNSKLIKTGINKENVKEANKEVKEILMKKGIKNNNSMTKMIDSISEKLIDNDFSNGNIVHCMYGIAKDVALEMKGELEKNPEDFHSTLGTITDVFNEAMNNTSENEQIPPELKNIFSTLLASQNNMNNDDVSNSEIINYFENIIQSNGLNREEFYQSIQNDKGEIDITKVEHFLQKN